MAREEILACGNCGNPVEDGSQRTCPHCLDPLEAKRFASQASLDRYKDNRVEHGIDVDPLKAPERTGVRGAFLFAAVLLVGAGAAVLLGGILEGGIASMTGALGEAALPLSMGAALFAVAWRYGRA